jgi:hypothetical protein
VILIDGYQEPYTPLKGEVWGWNGTQWRMAAAAAGWPDSRSLSGVVYDTRRDKLVLYGGIAAVSSTRYGDTWEWDGRRWQEKAVAGPGPRDHHTMAYDSIRGKTVAFGGVLRDGTQLWPAETWEWNGAEWVKFPPAVLTGRAHHAMAFDAKRGKVVLFGGITEDRKVQGDTWEWDGTAWKLAAVEGPPARARHRMAFDSRRGVIVLYGGNGIQNVLDDTWEWNGSKWTAVTGSSVGKRFMHAMAYDPKRARVVLYGGSDGEQNFDDTWERDDKGWTRVK